jgi:hypothetical protein
VRPTTIQPITLRELQVLRVEDVTPTMRRLVLGGDQLEPFERDGFELPEFVSLGFDDHVKIFFPDPVSGRHVLPTQLARRIEWSDDPAPIARSYAVRSFDGTEVAIDVVVHSAGVATAWALACARGDPIWLAGPKMGMLLPESTDCCCSPATRRRCPRSHAASRSSRPACRRRSSSRWTGPRASRTSWPRTAWRSAGCIVAARSRGRPPCWRTRSATRSGGRARRSPGWRARR